MPRRVIIVGGGISGLSAAYHLSRHGIPATILERQPRLGGVISTIQKEGCLLEAGPDSFLSQKPWALELIRELGLAGEVIGSNDHLRVTYVLRRGRLVRLPDGLMFMIPTRILPLVASRLLGWNTKIRMGLEWFRRPAPAAPPRASGAEAGCEAEADRSVADFVAGHYGQETVDYLAEPLLAGVYGGDPEKLSVASVLPRFVELERRYGSLTRGVLHERRKAARQAKGLPLFQTLKSGLGALADAVLAATRPAPDVLTASAETIERAAAAYLVRVNGGWIEADHVVLACQAYQAAALLPRVDAELARLLDAIPYSNSITISLGYGRAGFRHPLNGFGFLVPKKERKLLVACTWVGTKFSYRVPPDKAVLRCFVGGEDDSALRLSDDDLIETVRAELAAIMGVRETPLFTQVARWPRSMAQYTVGHEARVRQIEARLERLPGLHLAGNAYHGIGIPDCVRMGKEAADKIAAAP
ncbi:MAG: protoporphyrinogen oxidase [Bryobacteraceae bacterium]|jgi:oxygen-dependent protoporphyrinogen oxidase